MYIETSRPAHTRDNPNPPSKEQQINPFLANPQQNQHPNNSRQPNQPDHAHNQTSLGPKFLNIMSESRQRHSKYKNDHHIYETWR